MLKLAETVLGYYFYHLVESDSPELKQGELKAVCGASFIGWETKIPLKCWNKKDHLNSRHCKKCNEIKGGDICQD